MARAAELTAVIAFISKFVVGGGIHGLVRSCVHSMTSCWGGAIGRTDYWSCCFRYRRSSRGRERRRLLGLADIAGRLRDSGPDSESAPQAATGGSGGASGGV